MQKIRLVFRGWKRRREEREKEFLTRNAAWGAAPPAAAATAPAKRRTFAIDTEGLTVAYLDDSGQLAHTQARDTSNYSRRISSKIESKDLLLRSMISPNCFS